MTTPQHVRLSVNINVHTQEALRHVAKRDGISMTEAVRRLIGYGEVVDRTIRDSGGEVLTRIGSRTSSLVLIDDPAVDRG